MTDDRLLLPPPDAAHIASVNEGMQDAPHRSSKAPVHAAKPFRDSPLAATIVRIALAIAERERQAAIERTDEGLPGAHVSRGANLDEGFLNLPSHTRNDEG